MSTPTRATGWRPVAAFVVFAYALAWAWAFALVANEETVRRGDGWPTHAPALVAPALAALIVVAVLGRRSGVRGLVAGFGRIRLPARWWAAAFSPLAFLGVALAAAAAAGRLPAAGDFGRYTGIPTLGVVAVFLVVLVVNGFGEEVGWRGFLQPELQRRIGALEAALVVAGVWALWHVPFFFLLASYQGFTPFELAGFLVGISSGSIVLAWLYNGTGGSILAVALWHGLYNIAAGTAAGQGVIAPVVSGLVIAQAVVLVRHELRARKQGGRPLLGPLRPSASAIARGL